MQESSFTGSNLTNAVFYSAVLHSADLSNTILLNADIRNADIEYANLSNSNLRNANLSGSYSGNINFSNSNLFGANLTSLNLDTADLTDANLMNADMTNVKLGNADLTRTDMRGATTTGMFRYEDRFMRYMNTIAEDGTIKKFAMVSPKGDFAIRRYEPLNEGEAIISAKISESDGIIKGKAKLTLEQGAFLEVVNGKTLTVASDGLIQIDTDLSGSTIFNVNSNSGLVFEDGAMLTVNIVDDIMTSDAYTFAVISFEDDSCIAGLNNFVKDETLFLTVNGEKFNGAWDYAIKANELSISINVPEPATYAAIFGALALAFAAYRRRK